MIQKPGILEYLKTIQISSLNTLHEIVGVVNVVNSVYFNSSMSKSMITCEVAPTNNCSIDIKINNILSGKINFYAGNTQGNISFFTRTRLETGDIISFIVSLTDNTIANITITLNGLITVSPISFTSIPSPIVGTYYVGGNVYDSNQAIEVGISSSNSISPTTFISATVQSNDWIAEANIGSYSALNYVWARYTNDTSNYKVSLMISSTVSLNVTGFSSSTFIQGNSYSIFGTISLRNAPVKIGITYTNTTPSVFIPATVSNGSWTCNFITTSYGTAYIYVTSYGTEILNSISIAQPITGSTNITMLTSSENAVGTTIYGGQAFIVAAYVTLNNTLVPSQVGFSSGTTLPTSWGEAVGNYTVAINGISNSDVVVVQAPITASATTSMYTNYIFVADTQGLYNSYYQDTILPNYNGVNYPYCATQNGNTKFIIDFGPAVWIIAGTTITNNPVVIYTTNSVTPISVASTFNCYFTTTSPTIEPSNSYLNSTVQVTSSNSLFNSILDSSVPTAAVLNSAVVFPSLPGYYYYSVWNANDSSNYAISTLINLSINISLSILSATFANLNGVVWDNTTSTNTQNANTLAYQNVPIAFHFTSDVQPNQYNQKQYIDFQTGFSDSGTVPPTVWNNLSGWLGTQAAYAILPGTTASSAYCWVKPVVVSTGSSNNINYTPLVSPQITILPNNNGQNAQYVAEQTGSYYFFGGYYLEQTNGTINSSSATFSAGSTISAGGFCIISTDLTNYPVTEGGMSITGYITNYQPTLEPTTYEQNFYWYVGGNNYPGNLLISTSAPTGNPTVIAVPLIISTTGTYWFSGWVQSSDGSNFISTPFTII